MYNKVVWSEGMFLFPQHFQQQDRYFEFLIKNTLKLSKYCWGFEKLEIDQELLMLGKISLKSCYGIFQDGTFMNAPEVDPLPSSLQITPNTSNLTIYLGIPISNPGTLEVVDQQKNTLELPRYQSKPLKIANNTSADINDSNNVQVCNLSLYLFTNEEELKNYVALPIAKIKEINNTGLIKLDETFLPTFLNSKASEKLSSLLTEMLGLISQKRDTLANQLSVMNDENLPEIEEVLFLQILNQYEQHLQNLANEERVTAFDLYSFLSQAFAAFSTYLSKSRKPDSNFLYYHNDFNKTFDPLAESLREYLSHTIQQKVFSLLLKQESSNLWSTTIFDKDLLDEADFVIAVSADIPSEELHQQLPSQLKIGSIDGIHDLITYAIPGINLTLLSVVPRRMPYFAGHVYFLLDKSHPEWQNILQSTGIAFHLSGNFPNFKMEFLASSEEL
ncbi:MAG: type VI secretion system baseplate subunit TssK [Alphaproteobacteria bacterium]|nr:type VI secretion system baseplate subunit TssK [Alphaproteobacteria bacterium]